MTPDLHDATREEHDVIVPGQADRQGFIIRHRHPYTYRKLFDVPTDFRNARVFIRFESVSGTAKVWVNDHEIAGHQGGFTIWNREITDAIRFNGSNAVAVEVTDPDAKQWSSGFDHGGILRDVRLLAVPADYFSRLHVETDFDQEYKDATLKVTASVVLTKVTSGRVRLRLLGPDGGEVAIEPNEFEIERRRDSVQLEIPVRSPLKWDAEHPHLYRLVGELASVDGVRGTTERVFGFRKIEVRDRRVFVNGMQVKLRGGGRFDSDPVLGHTLSPAQCEEEVRLFKEANVNYIRPACCPALESYLDACDRLGMYVESETNVTFTRGSESDPRLTSLFVNQLAEMIEANRSHRCVLLWSLGNESDYGINIAKMFEYTESEDKTRPILFSWSQEIPPGAPLPYALYSYHYPDYAGDLGAPGVAVFNRRALREIPAIMPVLHDEFAHGACYCRQDLERDPNTRNFWGESIRIFWERMYPAEGCLGGAIWAQSARDWS
jgi:beta-galactosidase/beta-glucuronidase